MTYTLHKQAKHAHNDEYMYKNETNRVRYQPLTTPQVVLIFIIALHLCDLNKKHEIKLHRGLLMQPVLWMRLHPRQLVPQVDR